MYRGYYEEGDRCPECHSGYLYYPPVIGCACHINPPCFACVDNRLVCDKCGFEPEEPERKIVALTSPSAGAWIEEMVYRPRPLDKSRIDYRIKMHTHSSQICEGVYPDGTTIDEVEKVVRGSFGGRFEYFGNGKFKYIAYTD